MRRLVLSAATAKAPEAGDNLWRPLVHTMPVLGSKELLRRAAGSLLFMLVARLGTFIPIPNVDLSALPDMQPWRNMNDMFSRSAGLPANLFELGVGPLINASWTLSGLTLIEQCGGRLHIKELMQGGWEGQSTLELYVKYMTVGYAALYGAQRAMTLVQAAIVPANFVWNTMWTLAAGAMVLSFIADHTEKWALGDGTSLLIASSIMSSHTQQLQGAVRVIEAAGPLAWWRVLTAVAGIVALVFAAAFLTHVERRHPLVYYKSRRFQVGAPGVGPGEGASSYLPMRIMPSGMQPLLMGSFAFHLLPSAVGMISPALASALVARAMSPAAMPWTFSGFVLLTEGLGVVASAPKLAHETAEWMTAVEAGIKGLSPGAETEAFLLQQQRLTRFWGCLAIAALAAASHLLDSACQSLLGAPLGCQSILLLAGFLLSVERQVLSLLQKQKLERMLNQAAKQLQEDTQRRQSLAEKRRSAQHVQISADSFRSVGPPIEINMLALPSPQRNCGGWAVRCEQPSDNHMHR
ncbi:hypothetical protein WJX81_005377 [Elliptochloris bilobata]|uniref:SecY protein n=1 Tax=Elliptochloris bilobata TaxID=381761 RepID=A0AAW1RJ13_9CHLO